ncbi:hypothetical protein PR202_ga00153 [Eleusine coracana subsp. coracana]|uniref:GDSL esterase/lipase n=1 Tax=Eleusine coracana subsp. coracana TaxID=191504 RepID=A0AAV5BB92_ELECO|nr:hypothetical protein PR202_ga00153 [Eleusine coracana subsp. coracana]
MIAAGARTVVVMGMAPLGCAPYVLSLFPGLPVDYDPVSGCNMRLNRLAQLHNRALMGMLLELQLAHDDRFLIYADVYHTVANLVTSPVKYGFGATPLAACCGSGGGPYNFNFTAFCGDPGYTMLGDPSKYIYWDGIHFTEPANRLIAGCVLRGKLKRPPGY